MPTLSSVPKGEIISISGIAFDLPLEERISKLRDIESFWPVSLKQLGQFFWVEYKPVALWRLITSNLRAIHHYTEAESTQRILTFTQSGIPKLLQIPELVPEKSCSENMDWVEWVTRDIPPKVDKVLLSNQVNRIPMSEWFTSIEIKMNININRWKRNKFMMKLRNNYISYLILSDRNTYIKNECLEEVEKLFLTFLESIREVTLV